MMKPLKNGEKRNLLVDDLTSSSDNTNYGATSRSESMLVSDRGGHPRPNEYDVDDEEEEGTLLSASRTSSRHLTRGTSIVGGPKLPITLSWQNLNVYAAGKSGGKKLCGGRKKNDYEPIATDQRKQILYDVSGTIKPGQLVALMGASGAGKTTLMNTLTGRNVRTLEKDGTIKVNGDEIGGAVTAVSAYVQQDDLFIDTLTVLEHIRFQALLRLPDTLTREQKLKRADEVLFELGLRKCKHTRIGLAGVERGISGGEAKRLAFASEIITNPPLLFCDEPTTGLDSYMAESVVKVMQGLANRGKTILCTIHQPASEIYAMFDRVLLMAEGRTAFFGQTNDALEFFEKNGTPCPSDYNPADFYIQTLAIVPGRETECRDRVKEICDNFAESDYQKAIEHDINRFEPADSSTDLIDLTTVSAFKTSWFLQFYVLFWRSMLNNYRKWNIALILGLFCGLIYLNNEMNQEGINNTNGALYFAMAEFTFPAIFGVLNMLPMEYLVMVREHHNGMYKIHSYYVSKIVSLFPVYSVDGVIFTCIAYFMIGLRPTAENFFIAMAIGILVEQTACAFGTFLSCISPNFTVALIISGPILTLLQMTGGLFTNASFVCVCVSCASPNPTIAVIVVGQLLVFIEMLGGFFLDVSTIPVYLSWIQWLSWFRYGFEAYVINQWHGIENIACNVTENTGCVTSGDQVISNLSFDKNNLGFDCGMMVVLIAGLYLIGYFGLWFRSYRAR